MQALELQAPDTEDEDGRDIHGHLQVVGASARGPAGTGERQVVTAATWPLWHCLRWVGSDTPANYKTLMDFFLITP